MSDLNEWIKERRRIHRDGWSGTWNWSLGELDKATLTATGGHVDFDLIRDDEFRGPSEVLAEIVDAHNVAIPAALTAIEKVLELLDGPGGPDSWSHTFQGRHSVFADDVRAAIEGAIRG